MKIFESHAAWLWNTCGVLQTTADTTQDSWWMVEDTEGIQHFYGAQLHASIGHKKRTVKTTILHALVI